MLECCNSTTLNGSINKNGELIHFAWSKSQQSFLDAKNPWRLCDVSASGLLQSWGINTRARQWWCFREVDRDHEREGPRKGWWTVFGHAWLVHFVFFPNVSRRVLIYKCRDGWGVLSRACSEPRIAFASASDCNRGKDFVTLMMLRDAFWVTGAVLCSDLRMWRLETMAGAFREASRCIAIVFCISLYHCRGSYPLRIWRKSRTKCFKLEGGLARAARFTELRTQVL